MREINIQFQIAANYYHTIDLEDYLDEEELEEWDAMSNKEKVVALEEWGIISEAERVAERDSEYSLGEAQAVTLENGEDIWFDEEG